MVKRYTIFTDGAARGNPGKGGAGAVCFSPDNESIFEKKEYLGDFVTNNVAEYRAVLLGLKTFFKDFDSPVEVKVDSELICKQLNREYKVKNPDLKKLYNEVLSLVDGKDVRFFHVRREENHIADSLANDAIDDK